MKLRLTLNIGKTDQRKLGLADDETVGGTVLNIPDSRTVDRLGPVNAYLLKQGWAEPADEKSEKAAAKIDTDAPAVEPPPDPHKKQK